MKEIIKIESVGLLGAEEHDKNLMEYWKRENMSSNDIVNTIRRQGENTYKREIKWANDMAVEAHLLMEKNNLNFEQLKVVQLDFKKKINRLRSIINKSLDEDPAKVHFVSVIKVTESDGNEYVVNEGIEHKIIEKFKTTIISLQDALEWIEIALSQSTINEPEEPVSVNGLLYPEDASHKLILLDELEIIDVLKEKLPIGSTNSDLARLIAVILGIKDPHKMSTLTRNISYIGNEGKLNTSKAKTVIKTVLSQFNIKLKHK